MNIAQLTKRNKHIFAITRAIREEVDSAKTWANSDSSDISSIRQLTAERIAKNYKRMLGLQDSFLRDCGVSTQ